MKTKSLDLSKTYVTKVQSVDPLGQGRTRINETSVFIPKAIEEETVEILISQQKKDLASGKIIRILEASKKRINAECTHYEHCPSCQYPHVSYEDEIQYKKAALQRALSYLQSDVNSIDFTHANRRLNYRNRLQFHYQLGPRPQLGFLKHTNGCKEIISTPGCLLPEPPLKSYLATFFKNWTDLIPRNAPSEGHVELYLKNNRVHIAWNGPYSHLGFTQVNDDANQLLKKFIQSLLFKANENRNVLELFCGSGNLLKELPNNFSITGMDITGSLELPHQFHPINLYSEAGIKNALKILMDFPLQDLVLDPPRTGFKELHRFLDTSSTLERLLYVSCWPSTMVRDLNTVYKIKPWKKIQIHGLDMFPSTKHFETIAFIEWI